ncbi:MAG TPA: hypothetical protein PKI05_01355, partial [Thermogutta sp.]|nr:hypothetical protein [Thermogutta sp.]
PLDSDEAWVLWMFSTCTTVVCGDAYSLTIAALTWAELAYSELCEGLHNAKLGCRFVVDSRSNAGIVGMQKSGG